MPTADVPGLRSPAPGRRPGRPAGAVETVLRRRRHVAVHLIVYAVANALLVLLWIVAGASSGAWFPWPLLSLAGWGLVLQLHWWWAYGPLSRLVREEVVVRRGQWPDHP